MARVTVEDCLGKLHNRFALVLLVSRRAKQILRGSEVTVSSKNNRYIVGALREVAAGNVYFDRQNMTESDIQREIEKDLRR